MGFFKIGIECIVVFDFELVIIVIVWSCRVRGFWYVYRDGFLVVNCSVKSEGDGIISFRGDCLGVRFCSVDIVL